MSNKLKGLWRDERGQGMIEYIIIVVVIAIAAIVAFKFIGGKVRDKGSQIGKSLGNL